MRADVTDAQRHYIISNMDIKPSDHETSIIRNHSERSSDSTMSSSCNGKVSKKAASHPPSTSFLDTLFKEHRITDVNLVSDNAKPQLTVPRSVYLQSPDRDRSNKSISRWESIPQDPVENGTKDRRRSTSSSPSRLRNRRNRTPRRKISLPSKQKVEELDNSRKKLSGERSSSFSSSEGSVELIWDKFNSDKPEKRGRCVRRNSVGSMTLPHVLRENLLELVGNEDIPATPEDKIKSTAKLLGPLPRPIRQPSIDANIAADRDIAVPIPQRKTSLESTCSESSLRVPQRRASIDSQTSIPKPSKLQNQQRRASTGDSYSFQDNVNLTPLSTNVKKGKKKSSKSDAETGLGTWWKINGDKDGSATTVTQGLTPSPVPKSPLASATTILKLSNDSVENPPLIITPTSSRRSNRRRSMGSIPRKERPKSPPHQQPGTPPSINHNFHRTDCRRHSDSIIDIDMEVSKKLLHLAQVSSPVQPVRRSSFDSQDLNTTRDDSISASLKDFASDEEVDDELAAIVKEPQPTNGQNDETLEEVEDTPPENDPADEESEENELSPNKVRFSRRSKNKKKVSPRVCFSPRRMHSAPIQGVLPRDDAENKESSLLTSFRRRKPFLPGQTFCKTVVTTNKEGKITRSRTDSTRSPDGGRNRDLIMASLNQHSSFGADVMTDNSEEFAKKTIADLLPPAPSLDTPPQVAHKRHPRRGSLPLAPSLSGSPPKGKKKKRNRRRSMVM